MVVCDSWDRYLPTFHDQSLAVDEARNRHLTRVVSRACARLKLSRPRECPGSQ